jgi:signal transduction histidine kinase/ActR/RegA family two-component response regulator
VGSEKSSDQISAGTHQPLVAAQEAGLSHDAAELRRALHDLAAVSMLPALWTKYDAQQIAESVAKVLVGMLGLEFAYLFLQLPGEAAAIHVGRAAGRATGGSVAPVLAAAFADWLGKPLPEAVVTLPNPLGKGRLRTLFVPVGGPARAMLIVAARDGAFPTPTQRLLLSVTANQAAVSIGRWQAERELHRLNETLEQRVAAEIQARLTAEEAFRQAQKMEAIGQLTGGIAHDFNNILTAIFGSLEMVLGSDEPDELTRRLVATALRSAGRGARLTQQLLAFSRRQVLQPKLVNLNDLLQEMRVLIQRAVGEAVEIGYALAPELPACLIDPAQFETAVLNLVINARDAMLGGGGLRIETRAAKLATDTGDLPRGDYVVLAVADTGAGMTAEVQARAFEPFFTTKEVGKGSGLGLSMVYGFAKQSAGTVQISSVAGAGTTMRIYLPALRGDAEGEPEYERETAVVVGGHGTILMVEDNNDVRLATAEVLQALGYSVVAAKDGKAALDIIRTEPEIDLVLTDLVMPGGMSGIDLARELRGLGADLPVLLMSGYSPLTTPGLGAELDCGFIAKPFRPAELGKAIDDLLRAHRGDA